MFLDFYCSDVLSSHRAGHLREEDRDLPSFGLQAVGTSHKLVPIPGSKVQREEEQKDIKPTGNGDGRLACLADG